VLGLGNSLTNMLVPQDVTYDNEYSISCDGVNDSFTTGATFKTTFRGSFTTAFWVKGLLANSGGADYMCGSFDTSSPFSLIYIYADTNGKLKYTMSAEGENHVMEDDSVTFTPDATIGWTHIAISITKVGGSNATTGIMYVNGSALTSTNSTGITGTEQEAFDNGTVPLHFGALGISTNQLYHIDADFDEIAIWNAALDANAISAVYNSGSPFDLGSDNGDYDNSSDLVSYYKFTEGASTSVADSAGSNTGALVNGASWETDTP